MASNNYGVLFTVYFTHWLYTHAPPQFISAVFGDALTNAQTNCFLAAIYWWGLGGITPPMFSKRKLVKSRPCCRRNGDIVFSDLLKFFYNSSSKSNGQNAPQWKLQGWFLGGLRGAEPPLLRCLLMLGGGGGSAPLKLLHWLGFSEFIGLASKVLWSAVLCYMVIEAFLIVDYTISVLN